VGFASPAATMRAVRFAAILRCAIAGSAIATMTPSNS
jgi:hypothetical protein